jgi:hypothetical protein
LLSTYSINALSYAIITTYKLLSYILVSPLDPNPEVITAVNGIVTSALGGIILTYYSSLL